MISLRDIKFLKLAEELSDLSTYSGSYNSNRKTPVGCIVVYKNKIISTGFNTDKTHPLQKKYNNIRNIPDESPHKMHAELNALKNIIHLNIDWSKVYIYIYRKRKDQEYGLARPCKSCMALIKDIGIKHLIYTTNYGYSYEKIN